MLHQRIAGRHPRIRLQFVEGFSKPLEEQMAAGQIDLAVVKRFGRVPRRGDEKLCAIDSMVIGAPGAFTPVQEISFRRLADRPLVLAARPNALRVALDLPSTKAGVQLRVAAGQADGAAHAGAHGLALRRRVALRAPAIRCC